MRHDYLYKPFYATCEEMATTQSKSENIACRGFQTSNKLPRLQIPNIDFAFEASAVEKGAVPSE